MLYLGGGSLMHSTPAEWGEACAGAMREGVTTMSGLRRMWRLRDGIQLAAAAMAIAGMSAAVRGQQTPQLTVHWDKTTVVSKSTPTLQVVVNPPLRHGEPLGVAAYKAVKELGADYVRYVPWLPYPRSLTRNRDDIVRAFGEAAPRDGAPRVVLTQPDIRRFVRKLLDTELRDAEVVSFAELLPEVNLRPLARANLAGL